MLRLSHSLAELEVLQTETWQWAPAAAPSGLLFVILAVVPSPYGAVQQAETTLHLINLQPKFLSEDLQRFSAAFPAP